MGLLLDLAVAALAVIVIGSLVTLAWTLGVSATRATRDGRARVARARSVVEGLRARVATAAKSPRGEPGDR